MTITRHSKQFIDMTLRVAQNELPRAQAAEELGINLGTFSTWMSRNGVRMQIKVPHGAAKGWAVNDPDKVKVLEDLAVKVLSGELTTPEACEQNPGVAYNTLAKLIRRKRIGAGQPVAKRRTKAELAAAKTLISQAVKAEGCPLLN